MVSQYDSIYQLLTVRPKRLVFCLICGECLGKDRPHYNEEHIRKFPTHKNFMVMPMIDPLLLVNPDEWFKIMKFNRV